jgi:hypothetical protein
MNNNKWIFVAIAVFSAVAAVITTIIIFRQEIMECLLDLKDKIDQKKTTLFNKEEFSDYADV